MNFVEPLPFQEALEARAVRTILPSELRTRMLRRIPAELRERAMFSAGITSAEELGRADDGIREIIEGKTTAGAVRAQLKLLQDRFTPEELRHDGRLDLILSTNVDMARGYGQWITAQRPQLLDDWPASEFFRAEERKEPRDWPARWAAAGGDFFPGDADYPEGRMIALKGDPIWEMISAFGTPYAPFDFNSGMDLQDVRRDEAEELGLIEPGATLESEDRGFNDDLEASPQVRSEALLSMLEIVLHGVARLGTDGVLRFVTGGIL